MWNIRGGARETKMQNPTKTEAIERFLDLNTHADLADLYNHNMEVQVNVAQDGGTRVEGDYKGRQWLGWSDGAQTWKSFRIPFKAKTVPEYEDRPITFDLAAHAEGIGMTGWDWFERRSRWVGFDFDAITGHSDKHQNKLSDEQLEEIRRVVSDVEWVTLRRSTSGRGLHLYVFLEAFPTNNHTEHAAVARAVLGKLSAAVGYDFQAKVDVCGGNMWVWHRKMRGTPGLELLKQGTALEDIPINWKDHVKVVTGRTRRSLPTFIEEQLPEVRDAFAELTSQRVRVALDDEHKKLISWLDEQYQGASWWDADHHMLVTHTFLLQEAHHALGMRGVFKTVAEGTQKGHDWNAYLFPLRKGAWSVRRYTPGIQEDATWQQDGAGWTKCFYNRDPDLELASRANEGLEDPSGGFEFQSAEQAKKAVLLLGVDLELPNWLMGRRTKVKTHKSGRLVVEITHESNDPGLPGWIAKPKTFSRMFEAKMSDPKEPEILTYDDVVRHLVAESGDDHGWVVKSERDWNREPLEHVKSYLAASGYIPKETQQILGMNIMQCWVIVNRPFEEEFLPNRQWNRGAAQLRYKPTVDTDSLRYHHWLRVIEHCGRALDDAVSVDAWCRENGIKAGADYLKCWIASLFQFPTEPLPYLFLYGPQDSGKSILHEALQLLVTKGYVRADHALMSQSGFNGELENAILCVVEETDLRKNAVAYNRIKDWVTSKQLPIHKKQRQPYLVPNTSHWIQAANSSLACPVFSGDTRITMAFVDVLPPGSMIPKGELIQRLEDEAPDFLAEILALEIPKSLGRLRIPVLSTEDKRVAEKANFTHLELFVEERCFYVEGKTVSFSDFFGRFQEWLDPNFIHQWSKVRVSRELPNPYLTGRSMKDGQIQVINCSWDPKDPAEPPLLKLVVKDGKVHTVGIARPVDNGEVAVRET